MSALPSRWDRDAIVAGVSVAAMIAVPAAVVGRIGVDRDWDTIGILVINLVMLGGLFLGAGVAAWRQVVGTPLSHGLVVAIGSYAGIQAVFVAIRLLRGAEVRWGGIVGNVFLALGAGLLGGLAGQLLVSRGLVPPSTDTGISAPTAGPTNDQETE
ncbi:MAG: hypothetical protein ACK5OX_18025 [Desertimonas sp.]